MILTELKSILTSYDYSELEKRKENIYEAKDQLERRKISVIKDWNTFKNQVSIKLPDKPYDKDHILLVDCSDAYDFTPIKIDEVYVTDSSSYIRYFTALFVETIKKDKMGIEIKTIQYLWKNEYPEAVEFIDYLQNPSTILPFKGNLTKVFLPVPHINGGQDYIFMADYKLEKDPINKILYPTKIYPNDPCPCGSRKKYKKCCKKIIKYSIT